MFKVAPLHSSMMLISMFGFIITAFYINDKIFGSWAWAFMLVFVVMFIATIISMSKAPIQGESLERLAIHTKGHYKKR